MAVSELPGNPNAVWTVRRHVEGKYTWMESLYLVQTVRPREQHLMAPPLHRG